MTRDELNIILSSTKTDPGGSVSALKKTSYKNLPKWSDLVKEYEPRFHKIFDETVYPPKTELEDSTEDDFKRTAFALQKLAVKRLSQAMFTRPVKRFWHYDDEDETQAKAVAIIEYLYSTLNFIDASNIERAISLHSSCQLVTVWSAFEKQTLIEDEISSLSLRHKNYSEKEGYELFPILDDNEELLCISIYFQDNDDNEHLYTYTNTDAPLFIHFTKTDKDWLIKTEIKLSVFPCIYTNISEPVWGGFDGTSLVEAMEEIQSYQGLYIKRNALPTFTIDYGEDDGAFDSEEEEKNQDSRRVIVVGKGGGMQDVTWEGAGDAVNARFNVLRNGFFEQNQIPDMSFNTLINANTSAENKEFVLADVKARAIELGGVWIKLFNKELSIVMGMAKIMFPRYSQVFDKISVVSEIQPYSIRSKQENAQYIQTAEASMSLETRVKELGVARNVAQEVNKIIEEQQRETNTL